MTWEQRWGGMKTEYGVCIALTASRVLWSSESAIVWLSSSQYSEPFSCCLTGCSQWDVPFSHCSLASDDALLMQGITQTRSGHCTAVSKKKLCSRFETSIPKISKLLYFACDFASVTFLLFLDQNFKMSSLHQFSIDFLGTWIVDSYICCLGAYTMKLYNIILFQFHVFES